MPRGGLWPYPHVPATAALNDEHQNLAAADDQQLPVDLHDQSKDWDCSFCSSSWWPCSHVVPASATASDGQEPDRDDAHDAQLCGGHAEHQQLPLGHQFNDWDCCKRGYCCRFCCSSNCANHHVATHDDQLPDHDSHDHDGLAQQNDTTAATDPMDPGTGTSFGITLGIPWGMLGMFVSWTTGQELQSLVEKARRNNLRLEVMARVPVDMDYRLVQRICRGDWYACVNEENVVTEVYKVDVMESDAIACAKYKRKVDPISGSQRPYWGGRPKESNELQRACGGLVSLPKSRPMKKAKVVVVSDGEGEMAVINPEWTPSSRLRLFLHGSGLITNSDLREEFCEWVWNDNSTGSDLDEDDEDEELHRLHFHFVEFCFSVQVGSSSQLIDIRELGDPIPAHFLQHGAGFLSAPGFPGIPGVNEEFPGIPGISQVGFPRIPGITVLGIPGFSPMGFPGFPGIGQAGFPGFPGMSQVQPQGTVDDDHAQETGDDDDDYDYDDETVTTSTPLWQQQASNEAYNVLEATTAEDGECSNNLGGLGFQDNQLKQTLQYCSGECCSEECSYKRECINNNGLGLQLLDQQQLPPPQQYCSVCSPHYQQFQIDDANEFHVLWECTGAREIWHVVREARRRLGLPRYYDEYEHITVGWVRGGADVHAANQDLAAAVVGDPMRSWDVLRSNLVANIRRERTQMRITGEGFNTQRVLSRAWQETILTAKAYWNCLLLRFSCAAELEEEVEQEDDNDDDQSHALLVPVIATAAGDHNHRNNVPAAANPAIPLPQIETAQVRYHAALAVAFHTTWTSERFFALRIGSITATPRWQQTVPLSFTWAFHNRPANPPAAAAAAAAADEEYYDVVLPESLD
ncbi:unnamed protein product [Sphagnum troendelagicum]|uniref:C2H2-type domain-containing protein n=1 Tax=Sphagnum troendelagicum TaxID=128251 RepID=A0ABP0U6G8_9BRYO